MPAARIAALASVITLLLAACGSADPPALLAAGEETSTRVTLVVGADGGSEILAGSEASTPGFASDGEDSNASTDTLAVDVTAQSDAGTGDTPAGGQNRPRFPPPGRVPAAGPAVDTTIPLVIFDTDMGPDVDDALALAMLHGYEKLGLIDLAAVTVSRNSTTGAQFADAVNTFYGRPDIPIGIDRRGNAPYFDDRSTYVALVDSWPNDVAVNPIEDGFVTQRRVLAEGKATGRSVIIIQTGFSGNISQLLNSPGDAISVHGGVELVRQTVSELSIMAGSVDHNMVEFNVEHDVGSARNLFAKWPGRLAMSPFELGNAIHYPYSSILADFGWTANHPIKQAYEFRDLDWHVDAPPFYNMRSWDLTSVIHAVEPNANYFLTSATGTVAMDGSGRTTFRAGVGNHYVLDRARQYSAQQRQRVVDRMIELVAHQP
ncbi:MAG: nucleoside hydrolase [Acidimicrobiales bacterium]